MRKIRLLPFLAFLMVLTGSLTADEPIAPPRPKEYKVLFRYGVATSRNLHVAQFDAMMAQLKSAGFTLELAPDADAEFLREDATINVLAGSIASGKARKMLAEPHVQSLLLIPADAKPADGMSAVRVQIELRGGMTLQNQRLQADQLRAILGALGFRESVGYEHLSHTRLVGMIPAVGLAPLLNDVRLDPAGIKFLKEYIAKDADTYRTITETLDYLLDELRGQQNGPTVLRALLIDLKRHKAEDDFPYDLLVRLLDQLVADCKRFPAGADALESVLNQLQRRPAGRDLVESLLSRLRRAQTGVDLPLLFRSAAPVLVTEVFPDVPAPKDAAGESIPKELEKLSISPEVRSLIANKEAAAKTVRLEVILSSTPSDDHRAWLSWFTGLNVEGRAGPLVTLQARPDQVPMLAAQPFVSTVRLPRSGQPHSVPAAAATPGFNPLKAGGVIRLHAQDARGQGIRVAVIDGDFRGWQSLVGKQFPAKTRLVDLTTERNPNLEPDALGTDAQTIGHGCQCALALMRAAPQAELTLIRIDPAAPYQLLNAAKAINGEAYSSPSLTRRGDEIELAHQALKLEKEKLHEERQLVLDNFSQEDEEVKKRAAFFKKQADFNKKEQEHKQLEARYLQFKTATGSLRGIRIVASALAWNDGHPVDGGSAVSRFFDDRPFKAALWFQAAGNTRGQSWSGLFRDVDGNQVMEFAPAGAHLPKSRWTSELNFLAWDPIRAPQSQELPKSKFRASIQWNEVHDAELARNGEDPFRTPLASLRLVLVRQRDPLGQKLASDDLEVAAVSAGLPQRLVNQPDYAVYEQTLEFSVEAPGRFALRVEGHAPVSTRPASAPTLPASERVGELRPRIFLQTLAGDGRVVFGDFATSEGEFGVPGDTHQLIIIGAAEANGQPRPYTASGAPWNMNLLKRPSYLFFDELNTEEQGGAFGSSLSANFAAGIAASALSGGGPKINLFESLQTPPGEVLRVPANWPRRGE